MILMSILTFNTSRTGT